MRDISSIVLWAYLPIIMSMFAFMKNKRHALIASFVIGWQFLPMDEIKLPVLELSKLSVCSAGSLLGAIVYDRGRLLTFRPKWYDFPMLVWCICPFITSMQNDLGEWDGGSSMALQVLLWGIPYFLGRVYFNDWIGIRELALGIFIGALVYTPFCAFEMKMSPQLHRIVYGHFQSDFSMTKRWGGFRPMVFMQSGIALGMWMSMAAMVGVWLWVSGSVKELYGVPMIAWVGYLFVMTVLCKSLSSILFMFAGLGVLFWVKWFKNALPLYVLALAIPTYMYVRASGTWTAENLVEAAKSSFGEDRAQSLETRIKAENKLTEKAMLTVDIYRGVDRDPMYGWGRWSPYTPSFAPWRVGELKHIKESQDPQAMYFKDGAPTDGMWVITLGVLGILGLVSATVAILLPAILSRWRVPVAMWDSPMGGPAAVFAVMLVLHMLDNLLNAMLNPIFVLAMGGLAALQLKGQASSPIPALRYGPAVPVGFPAIPGLRVGPMGGPIDEPGSMPGAGGGRSRAGAKAVPASLLGPNPALRAQRTRVDAPVAGVGPSSRPHVRPSRPA